MPTSLQPPSPSQTLPVALNHSANGALAINADLGRVFDVTQTADITGLTLTGGINGTVITLRILQNGGGKTIALGSGVALPGDVAFEPSLTNGKVNVFSLQKHVNLGKWLYDSGLSF